MWQYIIPALSAVIIAIIEAIASNERKENREHNKRAEDRAKMREAESRLSMAMMDATLQLSIVTSNALTGGHNNGNVEVAKSDAKKAKEDYDKFLKEVTAKVLSS